MKNTLGGAKRKKALLRNNIDGITKPTIVRAARRGGVVRIDGAVYDQVRMLVKMFMEKLIKQCVLLAEYQRKKTIDFDIVDMAYYMAFGRHYIGGEDTPVGGGLAKVKSFGGMEKGRRKPGTIPLAEVRFYQKNSDSAFIPLEPFSRLAREVSQDYIDDIRFTSKSINLLRYLLEEYMVAIFQVANDFVIHSQRRTVEPKDIQLANKYCR